MVLIKIISPSMGNNRKGSFILKKLIKIFFGI